MSPALDGSSVVRCFDNRIIFDFYMGLPHIIVHLKVSRRLIPTPLSNLLKTFHMTNLYMYMYVSTNNTQTHTHTHLHPSPSHRKAGSLSRFHKLDMSRHNVLTHPTLHPDLPQLIACLVDGHMCLKVAHTTQNQVHRTAITYWERIGGREEES